MMPESTDVEFEYTVVLVFPGFGPERENAEAIVEGALEWLNANKLEPGFRFAPPVGAHLEVVPDTDAAWEKMEADDSVAMLILHDVADDERDALLKHCRPRNIPICVTVDTPRRPGPR